MDVIIMRLRSTRRNTVTVMTLDAENMASIIGRAIMVVVTWISTTVHSNINLLVADLEKERGLKEWDVRITTLEVASEGDLEDVVRDSANDLKNETKCSKRGEKVSAVVDLAVDLEADLEVAARDSVRDWKNEEKRHLKKGEKVSEAEVVGLAVDLEGGLKGVVSGSESA
jgi:hypothetical protein